MTRELTTEMISKNAVRKLREIYLDETITIYLREMSIVTVNESQGEVSMSPLIEGYFIDVDQDFIYLGVPDGTIFRTIPHATVGLMEITEINQFISEDMPTDEDIIN